MPDLPEDSTAATTAGFSRRQFLKTTAAGLTAVVAWPLLDSALAGRAEAASPKGPANVPIGFDASWLFGPAVDGGTDPGYDDRDLTTVTLPHTVAPLSWHEWDPSTWERTWLYRKHFDAPADARGMRVFLDFGAALTSTSLTLNGTDLPGRVGGYLPFTAEITDHLRPTGNVLAAVVDAGFDIDVPPDRPGQPSVSVDFWQPGGIYRDVQLRVVPQVFVADVFAKPVNVLDAKQRAVDVECTIDAATVPSGEVSLTVELRDGGRPVASTTVPASIAATGQTTVTAQLTDLPSVTLWELDNPKLYDVVTTLSVGNDAIHDHRTRIGFREATFTLDGFFLNGNRVQLFGVNRHQFFPFAGAAMPDRVQRKDAEILRRDLNCNMVRCSHYPQAEAFLDACDELGLMAWEEAPAWGYLGDAEWLARSYQDIGDMIRRDRNHPSVIVWGVRLNETGDNTDFYTRTNELAHSLDDSRQTVGAMAGRHTDTNYQQDVFSQNDYSHHTGPDGMQEPDLLAPRTDLPYMVSECVGALSGPARFYRRTDPQNVQQGQATAHARVHDLGAADDAYCGILAWSGYDYPSGNGNQYQGVKYTGVVDLFRIPKPGAAVYQAQVDPKIRPVVQPAFYWDFGPTSPVTALGKAMICANLDRLEVYVGDSHFASVTPDTTDYGHLRYPPSFVDFSGVDGSGYPELRIDGYLGSRVVISQRFSSDPKYDRLSAVVDDEVITGDGTDATRLVLRAVDRYGRPRPYTTGDVTLSVEGPVRLVGDNPFPFADTGAAGAVWLRSLRNSPGAVQVTATHPTLGRARARLRVEQPAPGGPPEPYGTLVASTPTALAVAGSTTTVTATFTNTGLPAIGSIDLTLHVPDGWTAKASSGTSRKRLAPGQQMTASWQVTVPAGADPQTAVLDVEAVYYANQERAVSHTSLSLLVPYPSLLAAFNNTAISHDSDIDSANFDGVGNSYSFEALAAAGVTPGATLTERGVAVTWPDVPAGSPDNVLAEGQTVVLSGSGSKLAIIGAGSPVASGSGTVYYADGTTSTFPITLDDYWYPPTDNDVIASEPYVNSQGIGGRPRGQRKQTIYLFGTTVPITAGKQVSAVTLPNAASVSAGRISGMHVFAMGIGG